MTKKKMNTSQLIHKIHQTRRSQDSNFLTTFIDNHSRDFSQCAKFSSKSSHLNHFYNYFSREYQNFSKIPKTFLEEKPLPSSPELDTYLDNIASGDLFRTKEIYRSKIIVIFRMLLTKYEVLLRDIFNFVEFTTLERDRVLKFGKKLLATKMEEEEIIEWFNLNGRKLARGIYIFLLDGKFPTEVSDLIGLTPEIYGEFTSLDIQKDIELNLRNGYLQEYRCDDIRLHLKIYSNYKFSPRSSLLDRIFFLSYLEKSPEINLTFWLSEKKKKLKYARTERYIGPKEINSGCTSFLKGNRQVSIWRKEELEKVTLHELIHSLDLEDRMNTLDLEIFVYQHFDIRKDLNKLTIFECYVEIMANILNVFFLVQTTFQSSNNKSKRKSKKKIGDVSSSKTIKREKMSMFRDIIWMEKCWSLFQAAKILNYFKYNNWEEFYHSSGFLEQEKTDKYQQKSNVFSYIILRSITFFRLNKFLGLCRKYNSDTLLSYEIPNSEMIEFWKDTLDQSKYAKQINRLLKLMREIQEKKNTKALVFQTMRMTCVEGK